MKYSKQPSLSSDTRLSRSGIFNNSSLNNSNLPLSVDGNYNQFMSNNINNSENKEVEFLRIKNAQLEEKNRRLEKQLKELENNKVEILKINSKYVDVVNRYYENQNNRESRDHSLSQSLGRKRVKQNLNLSNTEAHRALQQLEKDHRNLVKHCLAMQEQIKNYVIQMEKFDVMKNQLKSVNHSAVQDLIEQLEDLTEENKLLRKNNNQITYELEKSKEQCKKIKRLQNAKEKQAGDSQGQIAKMRSLINTTQQESIDKANAYESRIYQLELKVEKLEKQLRQNQQITMKTRDLHRNLQIQQVQQVHQYQKLQNSMADLLKSKQRAYSMYSKSKSSNKNTIEHLINQNKQKLLALNRANTKNHRRSLAQKSNIA